ncbi:MAG TPA: SRPBCC domain-containing protein [Kofleriaceae bacterium]|nr:SRPBCC domain-containing protein [Kofleriaceae bacterium]
MDLPFSIDRHIVIAARRDTVFRYFTDPARWAQWWGAGSRVDPRVGGEVFIQYAGMSATAQGTIVEIAAPERIVFTYGYDRPDTPLAPGASLVTITLVEVPGGTRVELRHDVATEALRRDHVAGWRYHMAVFGHVVMTEHDAGATATIDRYLATWSERDADARAAALAATCSDDIVYRDRYGYATGRDDLAGHIAAAQIHLPSTLARDGDVRVTLGTALVDWTATKDGAPAARGTSVVELAADGRIARVTGFWR